MIQILNARGAVKVMLLNFASAFNVSQPTTTSDTSMTSSATLCYHVDCPFATDMMRSCYLHEGPAAGGMKVPFDNQAVAAFV